MMTKYGTPDVCPQCGDRMQRSKPVNNSVTRTCIQCSYQATVQVDQKDPEIDSGTVATPATDENVSR